MTAPASGLRATLSLARHELELLRRDPVPFVLLLGLPLAIMWFFRPALALALFAEGHVHATGAEQAVPGVATTFSLFLVGFVGLSFFRDHGWSIWDRLRASPLTGWQLMVGKVLPLLLVAWMQLGVLFFLGSALFDLDVRGSLWALTVLAAVLAWLSVSLGLALVAVARTLAQINIAANLGTVVVAGLGGALVPLSLLPGWARTLAPASPAYWAMRGFRSVALDGGGFREIALPTTVLAGCSMLSLAMALHVFTATRGRPRWT